MKKLLVALVLLLFPALAQAQCNGVFPNNTACGNVTGSNNPPRPIPLSSFPSTGAGGTNGQVQYNNSGALGGFTFSGDLTVVPSTGISTLKNTGPGATGPIGSTTTTPVITIDAQGRVTALTSATIAGGTTAILQSRTAAQALNLSTFTSVETLGYAAGGDGGGARFKNVGSAPFVEQSVQTCGSIVGGSGYSGGPFRAVPLSGSATGFNANATVTLSGTNVSTVVISNWGGNKYVTGDVLTANNTFLGGSGSGFQCTVTANAALGSFVDSVGTHFQIITDPSGTNNVTQFGVKMDYLGNDATATDNTASLFNALQYAGNVITTQSVDGGGAAGQKLIAPPGSALICPTTKPFQVPFGAKFEGANIWATTFKLCDSFSIGGQEIFDLCDPQSHLACFGTQMANMTLYANGTPAANSNIPFVYSNNIQQVNALYRVAIYSGLRNCIVLNTGWGGAATVSIEQIECTPWPTGTNPGIEISGYGSTIIKLKDINVETGGSGFPTGIQITTGGFVDIDGFHTEGIVTGIFSNQTSSSSSSLRIHNATGGSGCTNLYLKQTGSVVGSIVGTSQSNGCTNTINNGGSLTVGPVLNDTTAF